MGGRWYTKWEGGSLFIKLEVDDPVRRLEDSGDGNGCSLERISGEDSTANRTREVNQQRATRGVRTWQVFKI